MKGIIFTEFLDFVDREFGAPAGERLAAEGHAEYRPGATYDQRQLHDLVARAAELTGVAVDAVLRRFGTQLFGRFAALYPVFFTDADSAIGFMTTLDTFVHGELKKLYADVQFPIVACRRLAVGDLEMTYRSPCALADLAEGLVRGCIAHFGDAIDVRREDLPNEGAEQVVRFTLFPAPSA